MGKHFQYISINDASEKLGILKCQALPFFHAFTGCDTTSQFFGKGKKSAWEAWKAYPDISEVFSNIAERPFLHLDLTSDMFLELEKFTCVLYDRAYGAENVNDLRKKMFSKKSLNMESIPPTQAALLQHAKRSVYQTGIWTTCLEANQCVPSPELFGWTNTNNCWKPHWTTLPKAAEACRELIKCGCKAEPMCSRRCRCRNAGLPCTNLCNCGGMCD